MSEKKCPIARQLLVMKWSLIGFLLAISYKSVLRTLLMNIEYEDTIDTIDDMLLSGRTFLLARDTPLKYILDTDPREKVKLLAKDAKFYEYGSGTPLDWVFQG